MNINSYLLRATTATDARAKAMARGRLENMRPTRNAGGQLVTARFLGIHQLRALEDKLEHGAEVRWEERRVRSLADAKRLVRRKRELAAFGT